MLLLTPLHGRKSCSIFAVLLLLALLMHACGGSPQSSVSDQAAAPAQPAAAEPAEMTAPSGASSEETNDEPVSVSVSGAFALFPMMTVWAEEYHKLHPNVTFDVQAGGAGKGMTDMLAGAADIAMLSRAARQEELDQGAFLVPAAIDAVVATVNAENPVLDELLKTGLTPQKGAAVWMTQETTTWGQLLATDDTTPINVYTRSDSSGAAEVWAQFLGGKAQEELQGTGVNGDPGLAEAVRQDPQGIGFNNIAFAYDLATGNQVDGIRVIPLDLNSDGQITSDEDFYATKDDIVQAIAERTYPYPPARLLYLVTKGEPSPAIAAFYRWVLTDGQELVDEAGFVGLNEETAQKAIDNLP